MNKYHTTTSPKFNGQVPYTAPLFAITAEEVARLHKVETAARLALDALEGADDIDVDMQDAITAIKEVLK